MGNSVAAPETAPSDDIQAEFVQAERTLRRAELIEKIGNAVFTGWRACIEFCGSKFPITADISADVEKAAENRFRLEIERRKDDWAE